MPVARQVPAPTPSVDAAPASSAPVSTFSIPVSPAAAPPPPAAPDAPAPVALTPALVPTTEDGAPVMPKLVEMMRWQAREGGGQAELRLRPESLGAVTVSIVVENGAVKATISAETSAAVDYLRAESSGLQDALEERGLTLDEFEVREESPFAERRRDDEESERRRPEPDQAPRRRAVDDPDAVFSVLV